MTRLLPFLLMSASLFATWLLLNQSVSPGHIALGFLLAITGGWVLRTIEPPKGRARRPRLIVQLAFVVLMDIIRSNVAVARIILGLASPTTSGFVRIPLEMRNLYGLAALAVIITSTPGTVWVDFDSGSGVLTIHVLDLVDETAWITGIKQRYERLLLDIFE